MIDKRLTTKNLAIVLRDIDGDPHTLRVNKFLGIQALNALHILELGTDIKVDTCNNLEMPPGYLEEIDATIFFPWQILDECGNVLYNSDGTYDYFAVHKGLTGARKSLCEYAPRGTG